MMDHEWLVNGIIGTIAILQVLMVILFVRLMVRIQSSGVIGKNRKVVFSPKILSGYEVWLNRAITVYMVRFVEERLGKEYLKEEELNINSQFVLDGINYVCAEISRAIPNFYHAYMVSFSGEDKYLSAIYEKVRAIFIEYVNQERKKRLSGVASVTANANANSNARS